MSTHQEDKKRALLIILRALILGSLAIFLTRKYGSGSGPYSFGLLFGTIALPIWIYGFIKYARAKGRSELLAILLSLLWVIGLIIILLLADVKKSKKSI